MNKTPSTVFTGLLLSIATAATAHPGHSQDSLHDLLNLLAGPIVLLIVVAIGLHLGIRRLRRQAQRQGTLCGPPNARHVR